MVIETQVVNINSIISDNRLSDEILFNNKWKQADFYRFCSESIFWGCAHLNKLDKNITPDPAEALVYLLQCERKNLHYRGILKMETIPSFINTAISDGYFANPNGEAMSKERFLENYDHLLASIQEEPGFEFYKNGNLQLAERPLQNENIIFVTSYANDWDNKQYFIETRNAWLLFGWGTTA